MAKKRPKHQSLAIVAFILSILFFLPPFSVIGVILAIIALRRMSRDKETIGRGLAIAAIVIGIIVTILQILALWFLFYIFGGVITAFSGGPSASMDGCLSQQPGISRDLCIFVALSVNINQTENFDPNLCDENVVNADIRNFCNALLKRDNTYCHKITGSDNRLKCLGLLEEMEHRNQTSD